MARSTASRVLFFFNFRPEYEHRWAARASMTQLRLDPLSTESARELLDALRGGDAALDSLKAMLASRIDRLAPEDKRVPQTASVIGKNVPFAVLAEVAGGLRDRRVLARLPLTGQVLDAAKALELGLVSELLPRPDLLPRAWALAEQLAQQPSLLLRYTRVLFTQPLKRQLVDYLGYGLALEGISVVDRTVTPDT